MIGPEKNIIKLNIGIILLSAPNIESTSWVQNLDSRNELFFTKKIIDKIKNMPIFTTYNNTFRNSKYGNFIKNL